MDQLPKPEGILSAGELITDPTPLPELRISRAASLRDLAEDYAFFNHSALFCWAGIPVDPVQQFVDSCPDRDFSVGVLRFDGPLFSGIALREEDMVENHTLLLAPRTRWEELRNSLTMFALTDWDRQLVVRTHWATVHVSDQLAWQSRGIAPRDRGIEVTLFGVMTNRYCSGIFDTPYTSVYSLPYLKLLAPREEDIVFARQYLRGIHPYLDQSLLEEDDDG